MDCRDSALFAGVDEQSCRNMLTCFGAYERRFTAGQTILVCGEQQEMIGVLLVPGCEGPAEEAVAKFLVGEKQGDPTLLEIGREEDPDDPMACMHDCAKCSGCGPSELLKSIPVEEVK